MIDAAATGVHSRRGLGQSSRAAAGRVTGSRSSTMVPAPASSGCASCRRAARSAISRSRGRGQSPDGSWSTGSRPARTAARAWSARPRECRCRCRRWRSRPPAGGARARTVTRPPSGVNLTALDKKIEQDLLERRAGPRIKRMPGAIRALSLSCLSSARAGHHAHGIVREGRRARPVSRSSRMRPASIFDMSRMSLMTSSRYCPLWWMSLAIFDDISPRRAGRTCRIP